MTNDVPLTYNIIKKMRTAKKLFAELNSFDENRRIGDLINKPPMK